MAIYHFSAKVISRAAGSSAVASAAYRAAARLKDLRLDRSHDFTNKAGVVHSEVMLPDGANEEWRTREKLWNDVEATETRKDAQLAREIEFAIPRELSQQQGIALARDFVQAEFVDRGMVADLNVHWDIGADGLAKPHAHVMLAMRGIETGEDGGIGFGAKMREWNKTELLTHWREAWATHANERLAELDIDVRIDHRSFEDQGIALEPQHKLGPAAARMLGQGLESERAEDHLRIARANGDRILADPGIALDAITHQQSTFTTRDLAMFVHRHSEGQEQFDAVMGAVRGSPELVKLGQDGRSEERFTSRAMIDTEARLERAADRMANLLDHGLAEGTLGRVQARSATGGLVLGRQQQTALEHITRPGDLAIITGYAGTGKSAMLGIAREAWQQGGYEVIGAALSGIAAENLESGSGIASRTIARLEHQWAQERELLTDRSVLVIDEAGMIGTRQMERVVAEAEKRGAKLVLVGDPEQLQAIEAGASFRSLSERHGAVEITEVRRQHEDWQRDATRQLATGRTGEALAAYGEAGHVHVAPTRDVARENLIDGWNADRKANPAASRIILTHTNDEVRALNGSARERLRQSGELGEDVSMRVERGSRDFAYGDRVMFLKNERGLSVKNGTLATVEHVNNLGMRVRTDDGRSVAFDLKDYAHIDHGYAATVHKAQGMTVDRSHVLATPGLDRHATYVALSRHRAQVDLHYGEDDFETRDGLTRTLSRERPKDMVSDYARGDAAERFAERRGFTRSRILDTLAGEQLVDPSHTAPAPEVTRPTASELTRAPLAEQQPTDPQPKRGRFDGLRLTAQPIIDIAGASPSNASPQPPQRARGRFDGLKLGSATPQAPPDRDAPLGKAVERYAKALTNITRMREQGLPALEYQKVARQTAAQALDRIQPHGGQDIDAAFARQPSLVGEAANGRTANVIRAMQIEAELRSNPQLRADRFVADWQARARQFKALERGGEREAASRLQSSMAGMARSLERDPQLESLLRNRRIELGLGAHQGGGISHDLQNWLSRSRNLGLGL